MLLHPEVLPPQPSVHSHVLDLIYERRSVRKYKDQPVDRKLIDQLVEAGRMAPSALNLQPYRFIIADNRKLIEEFSAAITKVAEPLFHLAPTAPETNTDRIFHRAPVVIFLAGTKNDDWAPIDVGLCAQNIMLAAKSLGLETCAVGFSRLLEQTPSFTKLGLHNNEQLYLSIVVGYGDESPVFHGRKSDNAGYLAAV